MNGTPAALSRRKSLKGAVYSLSCQSAPEKSPYFLALSVVMYEARQRETYPGARHNELHLLRRVCDTPIHFSFTMRKMRLVLAFGCSLSVLCVLYMPARADNCSQRFGSSCRTEVFTMKTIGDGS